MCFKAIFSKGEGMVSKMTYHGKGRWKSLLLLGKLLLGKLLYFRVVTAIVKVRIKIPSKQSLITKAGQERSRNYVSLPHNPLLVSITPVTAT